MSGLVNIWSHLLGAAAFCFILLYSYLHGGRVDLELRTSDLNALLTYYAGVTICFAFSTSYVAFMVSEAVAVAHFDLRTGSILYQIIAEKSGVLPVILTTWV